MRTLDLFKSLFKLKHYHTAEYPAIKTGVTFEVGEMKYSVLGRDTLEVIQTLEAVKVIMKDIEPTVIEKMKEK